ncbi:MAG: adenylosuccinate synthase [Spirochaetes bacterium]|nr:adenylosuccinate synthase [Spirochaetota bacterium]
MTHPELCRVTAERFIKKAWLALYEYQSYASGEFPDVLTFSSGGTVLYEIKMSRADFLADAKKDARQKWKPKGYIRNIPDWDTRKDTLLWINQNPEIYYIQKPHLGAYRYFVCETDLIKPDELPEGWGLYWYRVGKFTLKRASQKWRPDVHTERDLAAHAFRRYASGNSTGILVNTYGEASRA